MKNKKLIIVCSIAFVLLSSSKFLMENIIQKIGIKEQWVQREIKDFFLYNDELNVYHKIDNIKYPHYVKNVYKYGHKDAPKEMYNSGIVPSWISEVKKYIANNSKTETAKELCTYLKNYLESDLFASEYQQLRAENKPKAEHSPKQDEINFFTKINADQLKSSEKELAAIKKRGAKDEMDKMMLPVYESQVRKYKLEAQINGDLKPRYNVWQLAYPEDPAVFIKRRLEEYLDFASTVDFKATTTQKGKYLVFTNPEYEKKSRQWKAIYRAGADANKIVTDFIKQWLKEGIKINTTHMDDPNPKQNTTTPKKTTSVDTKPSESKSNTPANEPNAADKPDAEKPKKEKVIDKAKGILKKKLF